jgi:rhodanese-related sulfurtransferase
MKPETHKAMSAFPTITTEALNERLAVSKPFQLWNVLTDEYFKGDMIPGSQRLPLDHVGRAVSNIGLEKSAEIVVYCADVNCPFSGQAAEKLLALGYTNVRAYEGGVGAWREAGHSIVKVELQTA